MLLTWNVWPGLPEYTRCGDRHIYRSLMKHVFWSLVLVWRRRRFGGCDGTRVRHHRLISRARDVLLKLCLTRNTMSIYASSPMTSKQTRSATGRIWNVSQKSLVYRQYCMIRIVLLCRTTRLVQIHWMRHLPPNALIQVCTPFLMHRHTRSTQWTDSMFLRQRYEPR